jgi:hypothetical protein
MSSRSLRDDIDKVLAEDGTLVCDVSSSFARRMRDVLREGVGEPWITDLDKYKGAARPTGKVYYPSDILVRLDATRIGGWILQVLVLEEAKGISRGEDATIRGAIKDESATRAGRRTPKALIAQELKTEARQTVHGALLGLKVAKHDVPEEEIGGVLKWLDCGGMTYPNAALTDMFVCMLNTMTTHLQTNILCQTTMRVCLDELRSNLAIIKQWRAVMEHHMEKDALVRIWARACQLMVHARFGDLVEELNDVAKSQTSQGSQMAPLKAICGQNKEGPEEGDTKKKKSVNVSAPACLAIASSVPPSLPSPTPTSHFIPAEMAPTSPVVPSATSNLAVPAAVFSALNHPTTSSRPVRVRKATKR